RFRFEHAIPEPVVARSHPDVQAVAAANELRWFDDEAAYERAEASWSRVLAYVARLEADPAFRCLEGIRGEVENDESLRDYVSATAHAGPYAIFWTDGTRESAEELAALPPARRLERLEARERLRAAWRRPLAELAGVLPQ